MPAEFTPRGAHEPALADQYIDEMTGLPNRKWLEEALEANIEERPGNFSLVFIDLDGLKKINDTLGHEKGNDLLKKAADVLLDNTRSSAEEPEVERRQNPSNGTDELIRGRNQQDDQRYLSDLVRRQANQQAVRLHGDEFVILLNDVMSQDELNTFMDRVQISLAENGIDAAIGGRSHREGEDRTTLLTEADTMMIEDKTARKQQKREEELKRQQQYHEQILKVAPRRKRIAYKIGQILNNYADIELPGPTDPSSR